jgi:hypothetical protein
MAAAAADAADAADAMAADTVDDHAPPLPAVPARVLQTDVTAGSGNALQACVCSLLGMPLVDDDDDGAVDDDDVANDNGDTNTDDAGSSGSVNRVQRQHKQHQQQQQQQQPPPPPQHVPNFVKLHGAAYEPAIRRFCAARRRTVTKLPLPLTPAQARAHADRYCILRGQSPRGAHGHVVVARWTGRAFVVTCDPHPDGSGLDASAPYGWAMFIV